MGPGEIAYMRLALSLARRGIGQVEPNPAVGCVLVKAGKVVGRGWHRFFGGPHAEVEAIKDCLAGGNDPKGAAMYVTLEPCCHYGKTGPCTDAIISAGISRVVVATIDPSSHANGAGVALLRQAGIEVNVGLCHQQARLLNGPFFKFVQTGTSWVVVKWAQSLDSRLAHRDHVGHRWITSKQARQHAHRLRRRCQAVMVGINTVIEDDPLLTPRPSKGRRPIRVVLDRRLRFPLTSRLLSSAKEYPVLVCTTQQGFDLNRAVAEAIVSQGAELMICPCGQANIRFVLAQLASRGIQQVLVEGGGTLITAVLNEGLADEVHIYIAPAILGQDGKVPLTAPGIMLYNIQSRQIGQDVWIRGLTESGYKLCVEGKLDGNA